MPQAPPPPPPPVEGDKPSEHPMLHCHGTVVVCIRCLSPSRFLQSRVKTEARAPGAKKIPQPIIMLLLQLLLLLLPLLGFDDVKHLQFMTNWQLILGCPLASEITFD